MSRSHAQPGSAARWFAILVSLVLVGYWLMPSLAQAAGGDGFPVPTLPSEEDVLGESEGTPTPVVASGGNNSGAVATATPAPTSVSTATPTATPVAATGTPEGSVGSTADVQAAIVVNPVEPKPECTCRLVPKVVSATPTPTKKPTPTPTKKPSSTKKPTPTPTKKPGVTTKKPTPTPTKKPSSTKKPTPKPTKKPTATPTIEYEEVCEFIDPPAGGGSGADVLGAYSCTPMSAVSGYIFSDTNNNGRRDNNEVAYQNVQVDLWKNVADTEVVEETAYTNADGYWETDLPPGEYTARLVQATLPAGVDFPLFSQKIIVTDAVAESTSTSDTSTRSLWESLVTPSALWLLAIPIGIAAIAGVTLITLRKKGAV